MKFKLIITTLLFLVFSVNSHAKTCAIGSIVGLWQGKDDTDYGNKLIIYINTERGIKSFVLNNARNLNDPAGKGSFALLLHAYTTGERVVIGDDKGTRCDDINSVLLGRTR